MEFEIEELLPDIYTNRDLEYTGKLRFLLCGIRIKICLSGSTLAK